MTTHALLRSALSTNAGFSAASGLVLLLVPASIGGAIGIDVDLLLRGFGVALLFHAVALFVVVGRHDVARWAKLNLVAIAPYPVAMVAVAAAVAEGGDGRLLVLVDGAAIAVIAITLAIGLRESDAIAAA